MQSLPTKLLSRSRAARFIALGLSGSIISTGFLYSLRAIPILEQTSPTPNRDSATILPSITNGNLLDKLSTSLIGGIRIGRACATLAVIVVDYKVAFIRSDLSQWINDISSKFTTNSNSQTTFTSESPAFNTNGSSSSSDSASNVFHEVHLRSARRLLRLCQTNGGGFIKVGQHIAALDYMLPPE